MVLGTRFAEGKMAQIAEETLANKRLVMSDLGNGAMQTRLEQAELQHTLTGPW